MMIKGKWKFEAYIIQQNTEPCNGIHPKAFSYSSTTWNLKGRVCIFYFTLHNHYSADANNFIVKQTNKQNKTKKKTWNIKSLLGSNRFPSNISLYFALSIFPLILTNFWVSVNEKHCHSMTLPSLCFTVGMLFSAWWEVLALRQV